MEVFVKGRGAVCLFNDLVRCVQLEVATLLSDF